MRVLQKGINAVALVVLSSLIAAAQSGSIDGPNLGFVQNDSGDSIWPVLGVVGASVLGGRLEMPSGITVVAISPKHDYALARTEDGEVAVVNLDTAHPFIVPLLEAGANSRTLGISPSGNSASFYSAERKTLQIVSGLPGAAVSALTFDTSALPGDIAQAAVSDDGQLALVSLEAGDNTAGGLWAVSASGSWLVGTGGRAVMTFLANAHDAVIAEDSTQAVSLLRDIDHDFSRQPLSVLSREEPRPFSAIALAGSRMVLLTQRGTDAVTILDLDSGSQSVLSCNCDPTGFFPLKGVAAFRLTGPSGGPMTVLDLSSDNRRVVVIPPEPDTSGTVNERRHSQ